MEPSDHSIETVVVEPVTADSGVRRRSKKACEPCKLRKRRCDGKEPCNSCLRYEYDCYYINACRRKKSQKIRPPSTPSRQATMPSPQSAGVSAAPVSTPSPGVIAHDERSMEANSGVLFPHILGLKLNPLEAPKVRGFGWNLGIHYRQISSLKSMVWIISKDEWQSLFEVYLQKIHCIYGFLDIKVVLSKSAQRWQDPSATNAYDHVLCGVAALAILFSPEMNDDHRANQLVECAKDILESNSLIRDPTIQDAQAWLLRTMYLRCNSPPHAAWMASCCTIHIIEATGLHQEPGDMSLVYSHLEPNSIDIERRRRTFWVAKLFNTWISFEYGRSRICLQGASCKLPTTIPGDHTTELISMFLFSEVLDPDKNGGPLDLENALLQVEAMKHDLDALILSQCNLCFCLYRRLRLATTNVKPAILEKVITAGRTGLEACARATQSGSPWWHVSNVPFQFACILLAMDTKESLSHIHQAISTLRKVANHFKTSIVLKALSTIECLVRYSQKRKEQDVAVLQVSLSDESPHKSGQSVVDDISTQPLGIGYDFAWSSNDMWNASMLDNVNWDQFWTGSFEYSASDFL